MSPQAAANCIKTLAQSAGFAYCGISEASFLETEAPRLEAWLKANSHGAMHYMEANFDKRLDPRLLVPGARSVISLVYNYYPPQNQVQIKDTFKLSRYAYGKDYHLVLKSKMKGLWQEMQQALGPFEGRMFVDSAPVLEKAWAAKSGLGWIGKHSNLILPKKGSYYFLAELIIDLALPADGPIKDFCGTCTRCIDACPTEAITPYQVDGSKCISYFTIELKDQFPASLQSDFQDWVFGCDICQEVCPWNRFSQAHQEPDFLPDSDLLLWEKEQWEQMSEEVFKELFRYSALKRSQWKGIQRNIAYLKRKNEP